jgi:predicted dehydrogenase
MTIRAGIVGLGFMGRRYVEFLRRLAGVEVAAVCDLRAELAREVAEKNGARAFTDAEALAASAEVDAVFVCTPEDHHVIPAMAALDAGKAVMIEKPVAHSLEAARTIAQAARTSAATVMVGHLLRFEPRWSAARKVIAAGEIGQVVSISSQRVGNVLDQQILGGRTTIPLYYGVHDLDIVRWFAGGEASSIYAARREGVLRQAGYEIEDLYYAILHFENNILANVELGWHVPAAAVQAPTSGITVVGSQGWLRIEQNSTGFTYLTENKTQTAHPVFDVAFWSNTHGVAGGALANELSHFIDCVKTGARPIISLEDAIEALRLSLAMQASAERGEAIRLAEFG